MNNSNLKTASESAPTYGPIQGQVNRHRALVDDLHRAITGLEQRLNPILSVSPPTKSESAAKAVPSCEVLGDLTENNDALMNALSRMEEIQNRIQL